MKLPRLSTRNRNRNRNRFVAAFLIAGNGCFQGGEAFQGNTLRIGNHNPIHGHRISRSRSRSTSNGIVLLYSNDGGGDNDDSSDDISSSSSSTNTASYWNLPNDFAMFLTQRSIQSFMFLTSQLRDPETCYWVEDFTSPNLVQKSRSTGKDFSLAEAIPNLGDISTGMAATKSDWAPASSSDSDSDSKNDSENAKDDTQSKMDKRTCHLLRYHGLAAMDTTRFPTWDSFFENLLEEPSDQWVIASDQSHIPDYTWEIDPGSLCSRILSVREQLANEFVHDLKAVSDMGGQTFDWYWERLRYRQSISRDGDGEDVTEQEATKPRFVDPNSLRGSRENLLFLELNVDDPLSDHKPSPLRRGNFDLLVLLATEEAIHRVLNRWESSRLQGTLTASELASHAFLEDFYQNRQNIFHGPLWYGAADDLLEELLDSALLIGNGDGNDANANANTVVVETNPTTIAELILREREEVALDWMAIAKEAPEHHMKIQKLRLDRMMAGNGNSGSGSDNPDGAGATPTDAGRNGSFDPGPDFGSYDPGPGAFE